MILTRCFNQLPANSTKGDKALICWVHDVLMHRSGIKVNTEEREIRGGTISIIGYRHQLRTIVLFRDIRENNGGDILEIAFKNSFAIPKKMQSKPLCGTSSTIRLFPSNTDVEEIYNFTIMHFKLRILSRKIFCEFI